MTILLFCLAAAASEDAGLGVGAVVSTNTGSNQFNGLSINNFVGANRFYAAGYTGSRAVVANVEGGHVWSGHETLGHATTQFDARGVYTANGVSFGTLGQADRHATWVGHTIAGRPVSGAEYQRGIAPGATLWSGAIATQYTSAPWSNSWTWSRGYAFTEPYAATMLTGVGGRRTDVVNSSWGFTNSGDNATSGGNSVFAVTVDGIARQSRRTVVFSAGNAGTTQFIGAPANGYNSIVVGALGNDLDNPPYSSIASFSTRGAQPYNGPDGFFAGVRARVDIVAPGQNMTLAFYGGLTGGNVGGSDPSGGATDWYTFNAQGTSFAAPTVAGGAALLCDLAYDRMAFNSANATDGQVIKAVLLNSAAKPTGWNNGQALQGSVVRTTQALDYTYGAGKMDLSRAFDQFTIGNTDLAGPGGLGLSQIGWDYGLITQGGANDYLFGGEFEANTTFTATLNWFVNRSYLGTATSGAISAVDSSFTDLDLQVIRATDSTLIAESTADFINTEHLSFLIPERGSYFLRVLWNGERYDFVNNSIQSYGLAWWGTFFSPVPEPSAFALGSLLLVGFVVARRRWR